MLWNQLGSKNDYSIIFTHDKLLCTEQIYNDKNNVSLPTTFGEIPENLQNLKHF